MMRLDSDATKTPSAGERSVKIRSCLESVDPGAVTRNSKGRMQQQPITQQHGRRTRSIIYPLLLLLIGLGAQACRTTETAPVEVAAVQPTPSGFWRMNQADEGARLYFRNCAGCHGTEGEGAPNAYPALAGSRLVNGPYGPMLMPIMYGQGAMPGFTGLLTDRELALVSTYIRREWGNQGTAISPTQIGDFRLDAAEVPLDPFGGTGSNVGGLTE
ncbi:MAG: cytochrome c [Caldilinea sp. CFX5]|nr:cytochrome c [Caldilinea sp. CFX5]